MDVRMTLLMQLALLGLVCLATQGQAWSLRRVNVEVANNYVDHVLQKFLEDHGHELEPYPIQDRTRGFSRVVLGVNISGEITTYDGHVNGLTTVERVGDAQVVTEGLNSVITTVLRMGVVDFASNAKVQFMRLGPSVRVEGRIDLVKIRVVMVIREDKSAELRDLKLIEEKNLNLKISGLGPLNFILNKVTDVFRFIFKGTFKQIVEMHVRDVMAEVVRLTAPTE